LRFILAAVALTATTTVAFGEEAYTTTGKAYGACVGTQMRLKYNPPERIDEVIDLKCGKLEVLEEEQFHTFIQRHIGETLTAELARYRLPAEAAGGCSGGLFDGAQAGSEA
jgi:hypothetical protein